MLHKLHIYIYIYFAIEVVRLSGIPHCQCYPMFDSRRVEYESKEGSHFTDMP